MPSMLVDRQSRVFGCIQVPANFGQHSGEELVELYSEAILDLPRPLVEEAILGKFSQVNPPMMRPLPARPVMPNTSQGLTGGPHICALLYDRLVFMRLLTEEITHIQELLHEAAGGFDDEEHDICAIMGLSLATPSPPLNPAAAYLLRAIVRFRVAHCDYRLVLADVDRILEAIAQVQRGLLAPAVRMFSSDMEELVTQLRAWEAVYLEIQLEWFKLSQGFSQRRTFYRDLQRRRVLQQFRNEFRL